MMIGKQADPRAETKKAGMQETAAGQSIACANVSEP
jgi:hypothetical protein